MAAQTAEVVVIGGGIMGTATAYELARRGVNVTLLEKTHLGAGSTGRTGGIIRQHYSLESTARIAHRSLLVWQNFDEVVGGDAGYHKTGVAFIGGPEMKAGIEATTKMLKSIGVDTDMLDGDALREIAPYMHTDDVAVGAYEPDGGYADGALACNAYAARAKDLGATIRQGVTVTGIRLQGGRIAGVDTSDGPVDAPVVVNTAGPWGPALARSVGIEIPAEPSRHQIASFQQPTDFANPMHMVIGDFINGHYMRPETGGLTLAGSLEDDTSDAVPDPDNYVTATDRPFVETMVERSARRLPDLERGGVQGGWAGLYTVTPDWRPILEKVEAVPGFVMGLGFSGNGFKLGPAIGEMLADLATGQQECPISPEDFSLSRFAEGKSKSSDYQYSIVG